MRKYRVAFACGHLSTSGLPRTMENYLRNLDRSRFDPFVFEHSYAGIDEIRDNIILLAPHFLTPNFEEFNRLVHDLGIDIIHYNAWPYDERPDDIPSVEMIHNPWTAEDHGPADLYITIKKFQDEYFREKGLPYRRIMTTVDTEVFDPSNYDRKSLLERYGFTPPIVIHIGTVAPYKCQGEFLDLWLKNPPDATLIFVGPLADNFRHYWERFYPKYQSERVVFLGSRKDIPELLSIADVYVHTAEQEGQSTATFEASVMGKPMVLRDNESNREVFEDGVTALLRPLDESFIDAIRELLEDKEKAKQLGETARREIGWRHSSKRVTRSVEDILLEVLGEDRGVDVDLQVTDGIELYAQPHGFEAELTLRINSIKSRFETRRRVCLRAPIESLSQSFDVEVLKWDHPVYQRRVSMHDFRRVNVVAWSMSFGDTLSLYSKLLRSGRQFSFTSPFSELLPRTPNQTEYSPECPTLRVHQYDRRYIHWIAGVGRHVEPPLFPREREEDLVCISKSEGIRHWDYPGGWELVERWLRESGLEVVDLTHRSNEEKISLLRRCKFFLGEEGDDLFLAYYCGAPSFLLVRDTALGYLPLDNRTLISKRGNCFGCAWDSEECPSYHECLRCLSPEEVASVIKKKFPDLTPLRSTSRVILPEKLPHYSPKVHQNETTEISLSGNRLLVHHSKKGRTCLIRVCDSEGNEIVHHESSSPNTTVNLEVSHDTLRDRIVQVFDDNRLTLEERITPEGMTVCFRLPPTVHDLVFWAPHLIEFSKERRVNIVVISPYSDLLASYNCDSVLFAKGGVFGANVIVEVSGDVLPPSLKVERLLGEWRGERYVRVSSYEGRGVFIDLHERGDHWHTKENKRRLLEVLRRKFEVTDDIRGAKVVVTDNIDTAFLGVLYGKRVFAIAGAYPDWYYPSEVRVVSRNDVCRACGEPERCTKFYQCTRYISYRYVLEAMREEGML